MKKKKEKCPENALSSKITRVMRPFGIVAVISFLFLLPPSGWHGTWSYGFYFNNLPIVLIPFLFFAIPTTILIVVGNEAKRIEKEKNILNPSLFFVMKQVNPKKHPIFYLLIISMSGLLYAVLHSRFSI